MGRIKITYVTKLTIATATPHIKTIFHWINVTETKVITEASIVEDKETIVRNEN